MINFILCMNLAVFQGYALSPGYYGVVVQYDYQPYYDSINPNVPTLDKINLNRWQFLYREYQSISIEERDFLVLSDIKEYPTILIFYKDELSVMPRYCGRLEGYLTEEEIIKGIDLIQNTQFGKLELRIRENIQ